ncbi:hypothetical protein DY000_02055478 [Brassica cretica]|uniref:Uncharacterized protein n=1 Tax=Brassica cretica TaxID=69181 RepID=A0ABQ7AJW3_BRACR|nr:hypothetical protein DY000_02055478 [Brassica cretica]
MTMSYRAISEFAIKLIGSMIPQAISEFAIKLIGSMIPQVKIQHRAIAKVHRKEYNSRHGNASSYLFINKKKLQPNQQQRY